MTTKVSYYSFGGARYRLSDVRLSVTQSRGVTVGNLRAFLADAAMADLPDDTLVRVEDDIIQVNDGPPYEAIIHRVTIEAGAHAVLDPPEWPS